MIEDRKSSIAKNLAQTSSQFLGCILTFVQLFTAEIQSVSLQKKIFFNKTHKVTDQSFVLFEKNLRKSHEVHYEGKPFSLFVDSNGRSSSVSRSRQLEAFVHYTFHQSEGRMVVCDLEGVETDRGFELKTPTVHSVGEEFGFSDKGQGGVTGVMRNHTCNALCQGMLLPETSPDSHIVKTLKLELESLKQQHACKVCFDREAVVAFAPCKHLVCCTTCSKRLVTCPVCRRVIERHDVVFKS